MSLFSTKKKKEPFPNIKLPVSNGKQRQMLDKKVQKLRRSYSQFEWWNLADNHVSLPLYCLSLPVQRGYNVKKLFLSYRTAEIISF